MTRLQIDSSYHRSAAIFLAAFGILVPYACKIQIYPESGTSVLHTYANFVAVLWSLVLDSGSMIIELPSSLVLFFSLSILFLHLAYTVTLLEYLQERSSGMRVFGVWFLSQIPILILSLPSYFTVAFLGTVYYSGPTFLTLIIGLLIMKFHQKRLPQAWTE